MAPTADRATAQTILYYDTHAQDFVAQTGAIDLSTLYPPFFDLLTPGGLVLDAGCGSGRDTQAFLQLGCRVIAMDASAEMVRAAQQRTGLPVRQQTFAEIDEVEVFDGIWANASLLHISLEGLPAILTRLARALKPGGVLYASFKHGTFGGTRQGRHFQDLNEPMLGGLLSQVPALRPVQVWVTHDRRPGRDQERWLNMMAVRGEN